VEKDLEAAILLESKAFIRELGVGFAFLERQKRSALAGIPDILRGQRGGRGGPDKLGAGGG
jgi:hypothetical protein